MWRCCLLTVTIILMLSLGQSCLESVSWAQESPAPPPPAQAGGGAAEGVESSEIKKPKEPIPVVLTNAREAIRTFIVGMEMHDVGAAVEVMDFSAIEPAPDKAEQVAYAKRLKEVIDELPVLKEEEIGAEPDGPPFALPLNEEEKTDIVVVRCEDELWRFSADSIAKIAKTTKITATQPVLTEPKAASDDPPKAAQAETPKAAQAETPEVEPPDDSIAEPITPAKVVVKVPDHMRSARRVVRNLMDVLNEKKDKEYDLIIESLDVSQVEPEPGRYRKIGLARNLKHVMDRMELIDYSQISDDPEGPTFLFPIESDLLPVGAEKQPIKISRGEDGIWRFSADTVAKIDDLFTEYQYRPIVNVSESEKAWYNRQLLLGNETWRILALFGTIFTALLAGNVVRMIMRLWAASLEKRKRTVIAVVARTVGKTAVPIFMLIALSTALQFLVLDFAVEETTGTVIHVVFALLVGYVLFRMVDVIVEFLRQVAVKSGSTLNDMLVPIVSTSLRLTVIVLVLLEIATAISDKPPSSVIAGLGAGGLAIGLAAQDTIKNFFGSMMIYADRPFELGDRIVIDGHDGPVEAVGFRSTRIRTLDGHLVTVPNGEMAYKTIHNIGKRPYIRRIMNIRVAYDTPPEKVRTALAILRELLADHEGMEEKFPPRVFLHDFLETAINIRAIYWYHPPAYWDFCDYGERLNLEIVERFGAAGIRFALPSQRLFLESGPEEKQ